MFLLLCALYLYFQEGDTDALIFHSIADRQERAIQFGLASLQMQSHSPSRVRRPLERMDTPDEPPAEETSFLLDEGSASEPRGTSFSKQTRSVIEPRQGSEPPPPELAESIARSSAYNER